MMQERLAAEFTDQLRADVENFYFTHYLEHFATPVMRDVFACIPQLMQWDDHDIVSRI